MCPYKLKNEVIICYTNSLRVPHISVTEENNLLNEESRQAEDYSKATETSRHEQEIFIYRVL